MQRPTRDCMPIRLLRMPQTVFGARDRFSRAEPSGVRWLVLRERSAAHEPALELEIAWCHAALFSGDDAEALRRLDAMARYVPGGSIDEKDLVFARAEILIVAGRPREGEALLRSAMHPEPHIAQQLRRCWRRAALLDAGEVDEAAAEFAIVQRLAGEHSLAAIRLTYFSAFLGELAVAEAALTEYFCSPVRAGVMSRIDDDVRMVESLALDGGHGVRATEWAAGLASRVRAAVLQRRGGASLSLVSSDAVADRDGEQ